jgi:hypothetical protein
LLEEASAIGGLLFGLWGLSLDALDLASLGVILIVAGVG